MPDVYIPRISARVLPQRTSRICAYVYYSTIRQPPPCSRSPVPGPVPQPLHPMSPRPSSPPPLQPPRRPLMQRGRREYYAARTRVRFSQIFHLPLICAPGCHGDGWLLERARSVFLQIPEPVTRSTPRFSPPSSPTSQTTHTHHLVRVAVRHAASSFSSSSATTGPSILLVTLFTSVKPTLVAAGTF